MDAFKKFKNFLVIYKRIVNLKVSNQFNLSQYLQIFRANLYNMEKVEMQAYLIKEIGLQLHNQIIPN
jgi:hypothetical protein